MSHKQLGQVTLLPAQLSRLAEEFPDGGAVKIFQDGSVITAMNAGKGITIDAKGKRAEPNPDQEVFPIC